VLGDYSLHDFFATRRITEALGGRKLLVRGNQDKQDDGFYLKSGFERVYDLPVLFEGKYILSHEPVQGCEGSELVNLFGHVHTSPEYKDFTPNSFCLSCERIDYTPLTLDEILTKMGA
jgi:calcineurin-like phosphoesterase family protein